MDAMKQLAESFRTKLEAFRVGCDAIEEVGLWDQDRLGDMEVFYESELVAVLLRLIASDGSITQREADVLGSTLGLHYSLPALEEICSNCTVDFAQAFDADLENGLFYMRRINEELADAYKELLALGCRIIAKSDGTVAPAELETVKRLIDLCD